MKTTNMSFFKRYTNHQNLLLLGVFIIIIQNFLFLAAFIKSNNEVTTISYNVEWLYDSYNGYNVRGNSVTDLLTKMTKNINNGNWESISQELKTIIAELKNVANKIENLSNEIRYN